MVTKISELTAPQSRCLITASLPLYPYQYYDTGIHDIDSVEWKGGEIVYNTGDNKFYIQTATSGTTAAYKRLLDTTASGS